MPGPPPKPLALRELEGDRSKRRKKTGVTPGAGVPVAPTTLDREAAAEWRRIVPKLAEVGMLAKVDRAGLAEYCRVWSQLQRCHADMRERGDFLVSIKGHEYPNPALSVSIKLQPVLRGYLSEFGLTPAARARLAVEVDARLPEVLEDATEKAKKKWSL